MRSPREGSGRPGLVRQAVRLVVLVLGTATPVAAQQGVVAGVVRDSTTGAGVGGAHVELVRVDGAVLRAEADASGRFSFSGVGPGRYALRASRMGYQARGTDVFSVTPGERLLVVVPLVPEVLALEPLVVSASRGPEKAVDAPASVSVIDQQAVRARPALTVVDHLYALPGVDVAETGLTQHEVVARGFSNVASGALLVLTDYRYASLPSLRINTFNFIPLTNEDIERIEVVRGPGAALYGPNAANGVMHVLTASPLERPGTAAALTGGERGLLQAALSHAPYNDGTIGYRFSAQYLRADDWPYQDANEEANRLSAIAGGADPDTLRIGRRSGRVERLASALRIDWRPARRTTVTADFGLNDQIHSTELTPLGAAEVREWRYLYTQVRLSRGSWFAQAFVNSSDAGDTYLLRTGQPIVDRSVMAVAQVQHRTTAGPAALTWGLDLQRTVPRTGGTITGRHETDDDIDEAGVYLHGQIPLGTRLDVLAAARGDYHNRLPDPVFSPRAALVWRPTPTQNLRLTYNRAFSTPTTNNLFLDIFLDSLRAGGNTLPYAVRVSGVPKSGFTFRRDCGGLCMRSPFTPQSLGGPGAYLPVDATALWPAIVDSLKRLGIDLSALPPPSQADVQTRLGIITNPLLPPTPVTSVADIPPLRPAITNALELGYKAVLGPRLRVEASVYRSHITDFVGPLKVETPTAFFDSTSLATYLANFLPLDSARALANLAQRLPLGTVTPEQAPDPWDLLVTYRNFGDVTLWGADLDVAVALTRTLGVRGTYSWVSHDLFPGSGDASDVTLNASASRGALALTYDDERTGVRGELRGRAVAGYPERSGVYVGTVPGYAVLDAMAAIRLRPSVTLTVSAQNLLDNIHQEFLGAPAIGRLVLVRVLAQY